jgi:uncharacterized cupredoxin-like copper-binding protein
VNISIGPDFKYLVRSAVMLAILSGCGTAATTHDEHMATTTGPAAESATPRTIQVGTSDALRFSPDQISVRRGETVAFVVTNPGSVAHEFVVGDERMQQAHAAEMAASGGHSMHMSDHAVDVPAGQMATLRMTFDQPGALLFACHLAGHYEAGMRGTITVS